MAAEDGGDGGSQRSGAGDGDRLGPLGPLVKMCLASPHGPMPFPLKEPAPDLDIPDLTGQIIYMYDVFGKRYKSYNK